MNNWQNKLILSLTILLLVAVCSMGTLVYLKDRELKSERNQLTKRDAQVQQLDKQLKVAESNLLTLTELNQIALGELSDDIKDLADKYDLELQSRDETIANLVNSIKGGSTNVTVENTTNIDKEVLESIKIGYSWEDKYNRFTLQDPNIWNDNDELFTSTQHLRIRGYVFQGKDGKLQTRHVDVEEIYQKGNDANGKPIFSPVPGSSFELVDADFSYTDPQVKKRGFLDVLALRPYASFDTALSPGIGIEFFQLGRWIEWANLGIGGELSADLSDPLGGSIQSSRIGLSAQYQFIPPILGTNMALGGGLSVPFNDLSRPVFSLDLIFYLSDTIPLFGTDNG